VAETIASAQEAPARSDLPIWVLTAPLAMLGAGALAFQFDVPAVRWLSGGHLPGSLEKAISISEAFSHGIGVAVIVAFVWLLDRSHRAGAYGSRSGPSRQAYWPIW
jgi:hypothetical protein